MVVIKKDGTEQDFNINKVIVAIGKSAGRCMHKLTDEEVRQVEESVTEMAKSYASLHDGNIPIAQMHIFAELALDKIDPEIAKSYREYRNYKIDFCAILDKVYQKSQSIRYIGDVSNANTDSSMISTQRSLIYGKLNKELYRKFFLNKEELQAANDGFIYIHDMKDRLDGINCFDKDTMFVTDEGLKSFADYKDGDEIYTISHTGEWRKATVHSYGYREKMISILFINGKGDNLTVKATPDHRWILNDRSETTNICVGDILCESPLTDETWFVRSISEYTNEDLNSQVWCLEVEEDHSFLLENGIPTGNCCLFDMANVIKGGFEMGNVPYTEPKSLDVAFDVISDVTISAASQQYGGFTIPRVDSILVPYAEKSYKMYKEKYRKIVEKSKGIYDEADADEFATDEVRRDMEQGFQSWEMRFNTVGSSRGDYPFVACSFGLDTSKFGIIAIESALRVRMKGQGRDGFKKPVLFPKLSFFYDENLHGEGKEFEYLFDLAIECSSKTMYPDFISLTGEGYIPSIYKKYKTPISLMGKSIAHVKLRELPYKQVCA